MSRHGARLKRAAPWALGESFASAAATLLSSLVVAHVLSPEDFGKAAIAIAVAALVNTAIIASIIQAFVRQPSVTTRDTDQLFTLTLVLGLMSWAICWLAAVGLSYSFGQRDILLMVGVQGLDCLLLALAAMPDAMLTRKLRTRTLALRTVCYKAGSVLVTFGLAFAGAGAWSLIGGILAGDLAALALLWRSQLRRPRLRRPSGEMRDLYRMSLLISAEQGIGALTLRAFVLLFGQFHGLAALGLLNFASRLVDEVGILIASAVARTSLAFFSAIQRSGQGLSEAYERGTHAIMLILCPIFFGIAVIAPDLIPLIFGRKWQAAVPAVVILAILWSIRSTRLLVPAAIRASGSQAPLVVNAVISLIATLIATYLTKDAGFVVAVLASSARVVVPLPVGWRQLDRAAGISITRQLRPVLLPMGAAMVMMLLVRLTSHALSDAVPPLAHMVAAVVTGVLSYGAMILLFDRRRLFDLLAAMRG